MKRIECVLEIKPSPNATEITETKPMHKNTFINIKALFDIRSCPICVARPVFVLADHRPKIAGSQAAQRHIKQKSNSELLRIRSATVSIQIGECTFSSYIDMSTRG